MKYLLAFLLLTLATGCATSQKSNTSYSHAALMRCHQSGKTLCWESWDKTWFPFSYEPPKGALLGVVVLVPGWDAVSCDYLPLTESLTAHGYAVYGMELRAQRYDPVPSRRGNPDDEGAWVNDVKAFTKFAAKDTHQRVPIFIHGQSFGALLAIEALTGKEKLPVCGVVLQSPAIAMMAPKYPILAPLAMHLAPWYRVPLASVMQPGDLTTDPVFDCKWLQSDDRVQNGYKLRFLSMSLDLGAKARKDARKIQLPLLVMRGGQDQLAKKFAQSKAYDHFLDCELPQQARCVNLYPDGGHIITQGLSKQKAVRDIVNWIEAKTR